MAAPVTAVRASEAARPKIGFLWESPYKPGERHIRRQVLGSRRFEPVVLTRYAREDRSRLEVRMVTLGGHRKLWTKLYRKYVLRAPRCVYNGEVDELARTVRELDLRLLHVFFGTKAIKNLVGLRVVNLPVTVSFHGVDVAECASHPALSRHLTELFEVVSMVFPRSRSMERKLVGLGCPESKLWISRAGIPLDRFPYLPRQRREGQPVVFLQVCRLIGKKGLFDTLAAFDRVRRELPDSRLWIGGEGRLRPALEAAIAERGLGDRVQLLGMLSPDEVVSRLHAAHLFLHPSVTTAAGDQEGIPNSLLEAMATGLPAVASRHAGIPEAVEHGVNGWLVDERNPEQLAERMLWCAANPAAVEQAGASARAFIEREHALDVRMRMLEQKYSELITAHRPTAALPLADALRKLDLAAYRS